MNVGQIYEYVNTAVKETIGETAILEKDLSNLVDIGTAIFNADQVDNYCKKLVDRIGKVVFIARVYPGSAPKVLLDDFTFGSVVEKISMRPVDAQEDPSWNLEDGKTYSQDTYYAPTIKVKFFNSKEAFECPISFTRKQVTESFTNAVEMNSFIEMIYTQMENGMTKKVDALTLSLVQSGIAETVYSDYASEDALGDITAKSGVKAINLLYEYNTAHGTALTKDTCLYDKAFLAYASYRIRTTIGRVSKPSVLFNVEGEERFTPRELMHVDLWTPFTSACSTFLESDTFHKELVALPLYEEIEYWQGTGKSYETSGQIIAKTTSGHEVNLSTANILGVIFDRDAIGINNKDKHVTTHYNNHAEFWSDWYKLSAQWYHDLAENFVVFFVA